MRKVTPFLWFDGQAEEAAKFYLSIFKRSTITSVSPMSVMFEIEGQPLIALNGGPHYKFTPAISLFIDCATQAEIDGYWKKLCKGGEPGRCGWLTDKFGLSWQVVPSGLREWIGGKDAAGAKRAMAAMMKMGKLNIRALKKAYAGKQRL